MLTTILTSLVILYILFKVFKSVLKTILLFIVLFVLAYFFLPKETKDWIGMTSVEQQITTTVSNLIK
jgi:hypothetical protein